MKQAWWFLLPIAAMFLWTGGGYASSLPQPDPEAVAEVMAGKRSEANAAWWGFDPEDSTRYLQAAINSGATRVVVPNMGQEWIVRPIFLRSNQELVLEEGVVITARKGHFLGLNDSLFAGREVENLILRGYGATIRMHKEDYTASPYSKGEWRHGISLTGSKNVQILGLTILSSGGDGIYLGRGFRGYNEDIVIKDVVVDNNYRQGISVISVKNLLIENSVFKNTGGTAPLAGIDFEPNSPDEKLENIIVRNSVFENNEGPGITAYLDKLNHESEVSILMENIIVRGNNYGIYIWDTRPHAGNPYGNITIRNCIVEHSQFNGIRLYKEGDQLEIAFENCVLHNVASDPSVSTAHMALSAPIYLLAPTHMGSISFNGVSVTDHVDRPALYAAVGAAGTEPFSVVGRLQVVNPYGVSAKWDAPIKEGGLKVIAAESATIPYDRVISLPGYQAPPLDVRIGPTVRFNSPSPGVSIFVAEGAQRYVYPDFELLHINENDVRHVEVLIDDDRIFAGPKVAAPGEIRIDTTRLQDGEHQLSVVVETGAGDVRGSATFAVHNFRPLFEAATDPVPPPTPPTIVRHKAFMLVYVAEDEPLHVRLQQRGIGSYSDSATYVVVGPNGNEVARGVLAIGESVTINRQAPPGIYSVQFDAGLSAVEPEVFNQYFVFRSTEEDPFAIISQVRPLWFYVPEGTERFSLHMAAQGPTETARVQVIDPSGEIIVDKVLIQPETLTIEGGVQAGAWQFVLSQAPIGTFEDVHQIYLDGPIPPYLSDRADRLLKPASALH